MQIKVEHQKQPTHSQSQPCTLLRKCPSQQSSLYLPGTASSTSSAVQIKFQVKEQSQSSEHGMLHYYGLLCESIKLVTNNQIAVFGLFVEHNTAISYECSQAFVKVV